MNRLTISSNTWSDAAIGGTAGVGVVALTGAVVFFGAAVAFFGEVAAFCGAAISRDRERGLSASLRRYLDQAFSLFNIRPLDAKTAPIPSRPLQSERPAEPILRAKSRRLKLTGMII